MRLSEGAKFCPECGSPALVIRPEPEDPIRAALHKALGQQYEIQRLLGRGGMGAVYLATEAALEREVAIKVLPPDRGATKDSRDRFRREARTAAKLSHPNIVPLYTFGDVDGTLYFVMGYVKGESLAARLKRENRLPVEESRRIMIEIADALDYAHKLGIVHRDIKPDNVLIEEGTGRTMLMDFGVAKALGAGQTMTEIGSILGTPQYMSPEQAQGKSDIDHRSDLYSLGVMGYAMLAGRLPFEGPTAGDVMVQHITKEAPALKSLASEIPVEVATALTRCLAKDPNKRWPDARSLKQAITIPEDEETPPELDGLGIFLVAPMFGALILLCLAAWRLGGGDLSDRFSVLPLIVLTGTGVPFLLLPWRWLYLRKRGFEFDRILREIFRPLQKFPGWRPRRFRQPGDVWDRLPGELRHLRQAIGWNLLVVVLVGPIVVFEAASASFVSRTGHPPYAFIGPGKVISGAAGALLLGVLASLVNFVRFERFRRRRGLDSYAANRLIDAQTSARTPWSKPEIVALLLPDGSALRKASSARPTTAPGLAEAVGAIAGVLPEPARALGAQAHAAARQLADGIASLDKQIAGLARACDPAEAGRLADKIAALGPDTGAGDDNREVRDIFQKQLDTVRGLEARLEDAKARRAKRFELLKALWLHTLELQAASDDSAKTGSATGRIQKLLAQIEEQDASAKTVRADNAGVTEAISDAPTIGR
ncbi:MAG: serine/threonine protein kinase [Vicinamibacteria bacterium]|nr:serine/threonine protein kinase [Vicinamibacteria bacterium]